MTNIEAANMKKKTVARVCGTSTGRSSALDDFVFSFVSICHYLSLIVSICFMTNMKNRAGNLLGFDGASTGRSSALDEFFS